MSKPACAFALIALATVSMAEAQSAVPDLRGTGKVRASQSCSAAAMRITL